RAKTQLNRAVRAPPICRKPVGEGAKRVTTGLDIRLTAWRFAGPVCTIASAERKGGGCAIMVDFPVARNLDNARAIGPLGRFQAARSVLAGALARAIADAVIQRRNFILWPFAMIVGLIIYRILPVEPALLTLSLGIGAALILAISGRNNAGMREPALLGLLVGIGMALLPIHGALFGTPM